MTGRPVGRSGIHFITLGTGRTGEKRPELYSRGWERVVGIVRQTLHGRSTQYCTLQVLPRTVPVTDSPSHLACSSINKYPSWCIKNRTSVNNKGGMQRVNYRIQTRNLLDASCSWYYTHTPTVLLNRKWQRERATLGVFLHVHLPLLLPFN